MFPMAMSKKCDFGETCGHCGGASLAPGLGYDEAAADASSFQWSEHLGASVGLDVLRRLTSSSSW